MTLSSALIATRRRQLRPENYLSGFGQISVILLLVIGVRAAANLYLATFLTESAFFNGAYEGSEGRQATAAAFFFRANLAWCAVFIAVVASSIAYRSMVPTADAKRLRLFPLTAGYRLGAMFSAASRSFIVYLPVAYTATAWLLAPACLKVAAAVETALFLMIGLVCGAGTITVLWRFRIRDQQLETIEMLTLAVMLFANPDFTLPDGMPTLSLFTASRIEATASPWLFTLPLIGVAAITVVAGGIGFWEARPQTRISCRFPGLALYRHRLPTIAFVILFILETIFVATNPNLRTIVRAVVLGLFIFRWMWFAVFAVRVENDIVSAFGAPASGSRRRIYGLSALVHAAITAVPMAVYLTALVYRA